MIDEMVTILDDAKRAEKCNEIEKKHMSEVCLFIPFLNGPDFKACRPKLANYGAFLLQELRLVFGWLDGISRSFSSPPLYVFAVSYGGGELFFF